MRRNEQDTKDFNAILEALTGKPVVRNSHDNVGRAELMFSERCIVAELVLPLIRKARDEGRPKSQD